MSSQDSSGRFAEVKGHLVAYHENKSQSAFTQFHQAYLEPTLKSKIGRLPAQMADDQDDFDQNVCIYFLKNASALDAQGFAFWNQKISWLKYEWIRRTSKHHGREVAEARRPEGEDGTARPEHADRSVSHEKRVDLVQMISDEIDQMTDGERIAAVALTWPQFRDRVTEDDLTRLAAQSRRSRSDLLEIFEDDGLEDIDKLLALYYSDFDSKNDEYLRARATKRKELKRMVNKLSAAIDAE